MKLARFLLDAKSTFGIVVAGGIVDAGARLPAIDWARALHPEGLTRLAALQSMEPDFGWDAVTLLPPMPDSAKVFGVLLNYESARLAHGRPKLQYPHLTTRFVDAHVGSGSPLVRPASTSEFDYEGEIAVVIGAGGRHIAARDALDHVAGLTAYNDATPRDWMRHTRHFTGAKNFPATAGIGPWVATLDDVGDLAQVTLTTRLNGQTVQQGVLGDLTFPIPELIAYISAFTELRSGDVIATGTPAGSGYKRMPPRFLGPGDEVEVTVSGVGTLVNSVRDEGPA